MKNFANSGRGNLFDWGVWLNEVVSLIIYGNDFLSGIYITKLADDVRKGWISEIWGFYCALA